MNDEKTMKIAEKIENAGNIDIKETILHAADANYLGEKHFYCTVIEDGGMTYTVPEVLGDRYKSQPVDNLYFDIISKALDHDGIYISLAYCNSNLKIPNSRYDEIIEYDDYELEKDEYDYLMEYTLISRNAIKKFEIYGEEGISGHDPTEDVGIMINIIDGEYKAYFALRTTDLCMSHFRILPFNITYPKEHHLSFKNPINQILIEMIENSIIYKK